MFDGMLSIIETIRANSMCDVSDMRTATATRPNKSRFVELFQGLLIRHDVTTLHKFYVFCHLYVVVEKVNRKSCSALNLHPIVDLTWLRAWKGYVCFAYILLRVCTADNM